MRLLEIPTPNIRTTLQTPRTSAALWHTHTLTLSHIKLQETITFRPPTRSCFGLPSEMEKAVLLAAGPTRSPPLLTRSLVCKIFLRLFLRLFGTFIFAVHPGDFSAAGRLRKCDWKVGNVVVGRNVMFRFWINRFWFIFLNKNCLKYKIVDLQFWNYYN